MKPINTKKKILFLIILLSYLVTKNLVESLKIKNGQFPLADSQYRQANVPPLIAVMFDVPAYGKNELFRWNDFIKANELSIQRNRKNKEAVIDESYRDRLKRIGLMKAKMESQDYKKTDKKIDLKKISKN
jgi:hypothetical protein